MVDVELSKNVKRRWEAAMNAYVGRGHWITFEALSDATGVPMRNLYGINRGEYVPRWGEALAVLAVMPTAFADMVLEPAGLGGVVRLTPSDDPSPEHTLSHMADRVAMLARHLEDGRIDHRERAEQIRQLRETVSHLLGYVSGLEAPARRAAE